MKSTFVYRCLLFIFLVAVGAIAGACATGSSPSGQPEPTVEPASSPEVDAGPAVRETVQLVTTDGLNLDGFVLDGGGAGAPGVLLLHQFQQSHEQWGDFPETLAAAGYRVLAFSYRGHGASDPYPQALTNLLTDPDGAPLDVAAGLAALIDRGANADRIAIIGTSIGANLTVASAIAGTAKTYVSLSSRIPPSESLAGESATGMQSVYYVASENDGGGQGADAQTLFDLTAEPRQVLVTTGDAHGIALLQQFPDLTPLILTWLEETL